MYVLGRVFMTCTGHTYLPAGAQTIGFVNAGAERLDFKCSYLVGCDGARSAVRSLCGVPMQGGRGIEHFMSIHFV